MSGFIDGVVINNSRKNKGIFYGKEGKKMKKVKELAKTIVTKYGGVIACCAFAFVTMAANSACTMPFYEPEEPEGLERFKKFN